jgi:plastocyanin
VAGPALAQYGQPAPSQPPPQQGGGGHEVNAEGNVFTGGLRFNPEGVGAKVGETVRWRNTDEFVPHTATEDHGLWDLTGTYGQTPANPPGFGPGETRERRFEAGTHKYFCKVHPAEMRGTVSVPVTLAKTKLRTKKELRVLAKLPKAARRVRAVKATWAPGAPDEGLVYDVERRKGTRGAWKPFRTGTRKPGGTFRSGKKGNVWQVRARLRRPSDAGAATDWSPEASIKR